MKNHPIIIIGAGRSGTNILRDSICRLDGLETWPCDEINYIWRHGNITHKTDRFIAADANDNVKKFIRKEFDKFEIKSGANYIVEKTCANSLKIPFIEEIFPTAKYLFIVRNGFDVVSSARQRWTASLELIYIIKKVRFVPPGDMPYYGMRYLVNRIKKLYTKEKRLAFWGPIYPGMVDDLRKTSLIEVCGKQWNTCVETAYNDLMALPGGRVHCLKYEDFVTRPIEEMENISNFLGFKFPRYKLSDAVANVSSLSVGNYKKYLTEAEIKQLKPIIEPTLESIYYNI